MEFTISVFFLLLNFRRDSRDEPPFKKSIDNAFQGRDEQTHKWAFAVTECKENRTLHEKSRFAGAKRFALRAEKRKGLRAKSTISNCRAGRGVGQSRGKSFLWRGREYSCY